MSLQTPPAASDSSRVTPPSLSEIVAGAGDAWPARAAPWYRCAVALLVEFQQSPRTGPSLPRCDAGMLRDTLAPYLTAYLEGRKGLRLDAAQHKTLDAAFSRIVEHNLGPPAMRLHGRFTPERLVACAFAGGDDTPRLALPEPVDGLQGPITWDIASLTRDASIAGDEAFALDLTIRYWDQARSCGLPVDADFGAFYRAVEWMGLQHHFAQLGQIASEASDTRQDARVPALVAAIHASTSRYVELRPLQRFVERVEGIQVAGGFVMGRG